MAAPDLFRPAPGGRATVSSARPLAPPAALEAAARTCATCGGRPAAFGFGVVDGRPGLWFCHFHRADGDRRAA